MKYHFKENIKIFIIPSKMVISNIIEMQTLAMYHQIYVLYLCRIKQNAQVICGGKGVWLLN